MTPDELKVRQLWEEASRNGALPLKKYTEPTPTELRDEIHRLHDIVYVQQQIIDTVLSDVKDLIEDVKIIKNTQFAKGDY